MDIRFDKTGASTEEMIIRFEPDANASGGPEINAFFPGALVGSSVLAAARSLSAANTTATPQIGSVTSINGSYLGMYDYYITGTTTVSAFSDADWFTSTQDTASAWIIVKGNLTINSGQTMTPTYRKLFTVIYVTGNLVCNGTISMNQRGANHSGTGTSGGYTAPVNIRVANGTFTGSVVNGGASSTLINPIVPATGGAGGAPTSAVGGNSGIAGTNGGTGGGGGGGMFGASTTGTTGRGATGTCFVGGASGGSLYNSGINGPYLGGDGGANGGRGGDGSKPVSGNQISIGGAGNPGGTGYYFSAADSRCDGQNGLAGTLIVICEGQVSGSGTISSTGTTATSFGVNGAGSGGGHVTLLYGTNPGSAVTVYAVGGGGTTSGGDGTYRKIPIGAN